MWYRTYGGSNDYQHTRPPDRADRLLPGPSSRLLADGIGAAAANGPEVIPRRGSPTRNRLPCEALWLIVVQVPHAEWREKPPSPAAGLRVATRFLLPGTDEPASPGQPVSCTVAGLVRHRCQWRGYCADRAAWPRAGWGAPGERAVAGMCSGGTAGHRGPGRQGCTAGRPPPRPRPRPRPRSG